MKTADIVQLKNDLNSALEAAGRGEFRWFLLLEKLDELGYELNRRAPREVAAAVPVENGELPSHTGLFAP